MPESDTDGFGLSELVDQVKKCPECGRQVIYHKTDRHGGSRERPEEYYCYKCQTHFDTPDYGPPTDSNNSHGLEFCPDCGKPIAGGLGTHRGSSKCNP